MERFLETFEKSDNQNNQRNAKLKNKHVGGRTFDVKNRAITLLSERLRDVERTKSDERSFFGFYCEMF